MSAKKKTKLTTKKRISPNSFDTHYRVVGAQLYVNGQRKGRVVGMSLSTVDNKPRVLSVDTERKRVDLGFDVL